MSTSDIVFWALFSATSALVYRFAPKLDEDVEPLVPRTVLLMCNTIAFAAAYVIARCCA